MSNAPRLFLKLEAFADSSTGGKVLIQCDPAYRAHAVKALRDSLARIDYDLGDFYTDLQPIPDEPPSAADPDEDDEPLPMPPDIEKPIPVSQDWRDKRGLR